MTHTIYQGSNLSYLKALYIWRVLEVDPDSEKDAGNGTEGIVRKEMSRLVLKEPLARIPYKWFPLDAYTRDSNKAIMEIKGANFTMEELDKCGPREGAFVPQNKITYLQLSCGLTAGVKGRRESYHFDTGYFCYLLKDGIYYMTIQQILRRIFPEEGTTQFQVWKMKVNEYGVFFTSEHWTKLEGSDAKYTAST